MCRMCRIRTSTSMDELSPSMVTRTILCHQGATRTHQWGELAKKRWQSDTELMIDASSRGNYGWQSALKFFSLKKQAYCKSRKWGERSGQERGWCVEHLASGALKRPTRQALCGSRAGLPWHYTTGLLLIDYHIIHILLLIDLHLMAYYSSISSLHTRGDLPVLL
jgi:hypothetical protein